MANHWLSGYRVIAPSRFGYLGSELPQGASPENQAEAFSELLDDLRIRKAVVVAASAGSVSSLRLALKHADRVAGLALCGAMLPASAERGAGNPVLDTVLGSRPLLARLFGWNVPMWLVSKSRAAVLTLLGVQSLYARDPAAQEFVTEFAKTLIPIRPRARGFLFDVFDSIPTLATMPLEQIGVPTLIVVARDDPIAHPQPSIQASRRIPGSRLVTFDHGGHALVGCEMSELTSFVQSRFAAGAAC